MSTKWCRFQAEGNVSYGRIDGESVVALDGAPWEAHKETGRNVRFRQSSCSCL
jgi:hypothetical protein